MNPYLLISIEFGPVVLARLVGHIPRSRWDEALEPGRFTPREVMAHMADWEPIMRGRMEAAVAQPGATIRAYDEVEMARANNYAGTDPAEQGVLFCAERAKTAAWLRERSGEDWAKTVTHPERGLMTLSGLANFLLGHDLYHIEQLSAYLGEKSVGTW